MTDNQENQVINTYFSKLSGNNQGVSNEDTAFVRTGFADSPHYDKIEPLFREYSAAVSGLPEVRDRINNKKLTKISGQINKFFTAELNTNNNFKTLYPHLTKRIAELPLITTAEIDTVISNSFLTLDTIESYLTPYNPTIPTLFNEYYSPGAFSDSGMSSFCTLVPNIFAAFNEAMTVFNNVREYAAEFSKIVSSIQNFTVAGLIQSLKRQALGFIDNIIEQIKAKVAEITGLFGRAANFRFNNDNVYSKMNAEKQKIDALTTGDSKKNFKEAIDGAISYAASLFETLNLEEVQFLILRFCELISGLEGFFKDLIRPLEEIPNNFESALGYLKAGNFSAASRSINAGAYRISSQERAAAAAQLDNMPVTAVGGDGVQFGDEGFVVPGGIAIRTRAYKIQPISPEDLDILNNELTYDRVRQSGLTPIYLITGNTSNRIDKEKSWDNVRPLEKIMLYRLSQRMGRMITVISAFRSLRAQAAVNPSVKSSFHSSGQAFDIANNTFSGLGFEKFKSLANSVGFSCVNPYPSFVHIDTGPNRNW